MAARFTRPYVDALFDVAAGTENVEKLLPPLQDVSNAIASSDELRRFLLNPAVDRARKDALLAGLGKSAKLDPLGIRLLSALLGNNRVHRLAAVLTAIRERQDTERRIAAARVRSATVLDEKTRSSILAVLEKKTGKKIRLETEIDPSLLGGFVVQMGSELYDASLASRLKKTREALAAASAHS